MENKQSGLKGRMEDFAFEVGRKEEKKAPKADKSPREKTKT